VIQSILVTNSSPHNAAVAFVARYGLRVTPYSDPNEPLPDADMAVICTDKVPPGSPLYEKVKESFDGDTLLMAKTDLSQSRDKFEALVYGSALDVVRGADVQSTVKLAWVLARCVPVGKAFNSKVLLTYAAHLLAEGDMHFSVMNNFLVRCMAKGDAKQTKKRGEYVYNGLSEYFMTKLSKLDLALPAFRKSEDKTSMLAPGVSRASATIATLSKTEDVSAEPGTRVFPSTPQQTETASGDTGATGRLLMVHLGRVEATIARLEEKINAQTEISKLMPKVSRLSSDQLTKLNTLVETLFSFNDTTGSWPL